MQSMGSATWRDILRGDPPAAGLPELFDELERCGWKARTRVGQFALRFWPDNARGKQMVIDMRYPLNDHKLETYRAHTGLVLAVEIAEGGNR